MSCDLRPVCACTDSCTDSCNPTHPLNRPHACCHNSPQDIVRQLGLGGPAGGRLRSWVLSFSRSNLRLSVELKKGTGAGAWLAVAMRVCCPCVSLSVSCVVGGLAEQH